MALAPDHAQVQGPMFCHSLGAGLGLGACLVPWAGCRGCHLLWGDPEVPQGPRSLYVTHTNQAGLEGHLQVGTCIPLSHLLPG